jgi:hypothetical protein
MSNRHLVVSTHEGHVTVTVEGRDLLELVDDHLTDRDVIYDHSVEVEERGRATFTMHFAPALSLQRIQELLNEIPDAEIERARSERGS